MDFQVYVIRLLSAISQENRIKILKFLGKNEKCVCKIYPALGLEQSNLSKHLRILTDAGVLEFRKQGNSIFYKIKDPKILDIIKLAEKIVSDDLKILSDLVN